MSKKILSFSRRYFGLFRAAAIIIVFGFILHTAHRECARNADKPYPIQIASQPAAPAPVQKGHKRPAGEEFHATAYCVPGLTKAGVKTAPGLVSADPSVIPLGSMIYVETPFMSGIYQVMDTGELIKGKIIDIFVPSYESAKSFGRRIVKVKVLRYGFGGDSAENKTKK
jgi:3D (Asp-Asp-Asp) domain-containing protein